MRELNAENTAAYLRETGRLPQDTQAVVRELAGGVSNVVLRVDLPGRPPFVIKQCRERLRVTMDWRARLDRIWMERATLGLLEQILPAGTVPRLLFEDRDEYLFGMSCAPDDAVTWKAQLMSGGVDPAIASALGTLLATLHANAAGRPELSATLADTSLFDELRIDPYYHTTAAAHPQTAPFYNDLIASMDRPAAERTLVLGDFSPKNILVHSGGLILLDFECGHAGDAAFDLGFFLSHLLLKAVHLRHLKEAGAAPFEELTLHFWSAYLDELQRGPWHPQAIVPRAIRHTLACLLARVDGKSPVEYLGEPDRQLVRDLALHAINNPPETWPRLLDCYKSGFKAIDRGAEPTDSPST